MASELTDMTPSTGAVTGDTTASSNGNHVTTNPIRRPDRISNCKKSIGEILVMLGAISSDQLANAEEKRAAAGGKADISGVLFKLGYVSEEQITRARALQLGIAYADPSKYDADAGISLEVLGLISAEAARQYLIIPIGYSTEAGAMRVVSSRWTQNTLEACKNLFAGVELNIEPLLGADKHVRKALEVHYPLETGTEDMSSNNHGAPQQPKISAVPAVVDPRKSATPVRVAAASSTVRASDVLSAAANPQIQFAGQIQKEQEADVDQLEFSVDQPAIIQMVNKLISDAIAHRASDIHFEPMRDGVLVKYRIDGALNNWDKVPKGFAAACTSRLKVMADMNIAERRVPQDGRITVRTGGRTVDMRVSSLPTNYGEAVVLRILDKTAMRLDINHLGFGERNLRTLQNMIKKPHGIFLATGPTGSGKTTTLYAAVHAIQAPELNIVTVEDPIEYELEGIRQSNTNEKAGLTFAKQLRAILRQDPDVIYVGEIRDAETAEIAFRAAMTGHLVFSTLHCNDAASSVTRLLNMGVDPFLIASSVIGVLAQRLVRKICTNCKAPYKPRPEELWLLGLDPESDEVRSARFARGAGCPECNNSGYAGRCSVQELMAMDDTVRQLTLERAASTKIRSAAISQSNNPMIPMRRDAAVKVMAGISTVEEVQKRVMLDED